MHRSHRSVIPETVFTSDDTESDDASLVVMNIEPLSTCIRCS
ncbi:hypothetical protein IC582_015014 [Cucumis melo]